LVPAFNKADEDKRIQMKKKVKHWLKRLLDDKFRECVITTQNGSKAAHQTYGIPREKVDEFKHWASKVMAEIGF
jgi:hypothetical protein